MVAGRRIYRVGRICNESARYFRILATYFWRFPFPPHVLMIPKLLAWAPHILFIMVMPSKFGMVSTLFLYCPPYRLRAKLLLSLFEDRTCLSDTLTQGRIKLFGVPRQWKYFRPLFQAVFLSGGGITPQTESNTTPPSPKTEITNILFYILNFASIIKLKM